ncbi:zinc-binding dehydrogenase [Candidatus Ponderosibacter sp. Uisw_141_02]|uniref:zinc-binding dehydrogenase n=1 Tax=Candidatus Ponderosibacter sp. Uisw_141_02 TaxID=3231000 RepID=UPI003D392403
MLPKKMFAAILVKQNCQLVVDEVLLPKELAVGQVLVKLSYSGICGSQIGEIRGVKGEDKYLPHLLGHEGSGFVESIGPGVSKVQKGDPVVLHWKEGIGIQSEPPKYDWKNRQLNAGLITTFNEFAIVSENRLTPVPSGTDMRTLCLYGCAITTGFGVVENVAQIKLGESLVVFGSGGVGLNIIQAAAMRGAYPIIAVDKFANRLALSELIGATHVINSLREDVTGKILSILNGIGPDNFIDNTGNTDVISLGYSITNKSGKVILVGVPETGRSVSLNTLPLHFGKKITGTHGGDGHPTQDIPRYLKICKSKEVDLNSIISEEYRLKDINHAIESMTTGSSAGRCLIAFKE